MRYGAKFLKLFYWASLCLCSSYVYAGAGHDHGHNDTQTTINPSDNMPRLTLSSKQFELVGWLEGKNLHLYLDDYASNRPITKANISLELAGKTLSAHPEEGGYHIELPESLKDGHYPVMATILSESSADLLAGELEVHTEHTEAQQTQHLGVTISVNQLIIIACALVILLLLSILVMRRDTQKRGLAS